MQGERGPGAGNKKFEEDGENVVPTLLSCASESELLPASLSHLRVSAINAEPWGRSSATPGEARAAARGSAVLPGMARSTAAVADVGVRCTLAAASDD